MSSLGKWLMVIFGLGTIGIEGYTLAFKHPTPYSAILGVIVVLIWGMYFGALFKSETK